jgi:hypothetical protein
MSKRPGARSGSWAERLVQGLGAGRAPGREEAFAAALAALWDLFDRTRSQANEALAAAGIKDGILVREEGMVRHYYGAGPEGQVRKIAVLPLRRGEGGEDFGAYIGISSTNASMYVVPVEKGGQVAWQVAASGQPFDAAVVQDLFLSIFANDPGAISRLSPLSGASYFLTPWD